MVCLKETLQSHCSSTTTAVLTSQHISEPIKERLTSHVTTVSDMLHDCSEDLLCLSVLYPAAPWVSYPFTKFICSHKFSLLKNPWVSLHFCGSEAYVSYLKCAIQGGTLTLIGPAFLNWSQGMESPNEWLHSFW